MYPESSEGTKKRPWGGMDTAAAPCKDAAVTPSPLPGRMPSAAPPTPSESAQTNREAEYSASQAAMCDRDTKGTMPACAPLAVPYVPFQQTGSARYSQNDALNNGTLFPGLNLPFHVKAQASDVVGNAANRALAELQAMEFVILELGLYLDTHQDDREAFELYRKYVALEKEGRKRYVEQYGPLFQTESAKSDSFTWLKDPWPWNYPEGGTR